MRHVDVPDEIAHSLAKQLKGSGLSSTERKTAKPKKNTKPKYIPVVAIVNGKSARTTLVPAGPGGSSRGCLLEQGDRGVEATGAGVSR